MRVLVSEGPGASEATRSVLGPEERRVLFWAGEGSMCDAAQSEREREKEREPHVMRRIDANAYDSERKVSVLAGPGSPCARVWAPVLSSGAGLTMEWFEPV